MYMLCSVVDCGNSHYCKGLCRKHYNKQWKESHEEETREYGARWRRENKEARIVYNRIYATTDIGRFNKAKSKAKGRELKWDIEFETFIDISSRPCFYCNDELCGKEKFQGAHLDRIDNSLGYEIDNVVSCGLLCNTIRMSNLTVAEAKDAIEGILAGRKRRADI